MTTLIKIDYKQALRLKAEHCHIFADPDALIELMWHDSYGCFTRKQFPDLVETEDFYTIESSGATNSYINGGKWDADNKCNIGLQAAKERLENDTLKLFIEAYSRGPLHKLTSRDVIRDSRINFIAIPKHLQSKLGAQALYANAPKDKVLAELSQLSTSYGFNLAKLASPFADVEKYLFDTYTIYLKGN